MIEVKTDIKGTNRVRNSMRRWVSLNKKSLSADMWSWTQNTRRVLKATPYAPFRGIPPNRRTGRMANSWAVEKNGEVDFTIVNRATNNGFNYPIKIVGPMNRRITGRRTPGSTHWWSYANVIGGELPKLRDTIEGRFKAAEQA